MTFYLRKIFLLVIFVSITNSLFSQGFIQKMYNEGSGAKFAEGNSQLDATGGSIIVGYSVIPSVSLNSVIHYVDANGNLQWQLDVPDLRDSPFAKVVCAQNGDFLICGSTKLGTPANSIYDDNVLLMRISHTGQVLWSYAYGNKWDDKAYSLAELPSGIIEIVGITNDSASGGNWGPFRMRISATGTLLQNDVISLTPFLNLNQIYYDSASKQYVISRFNTGALFVGLADSTFHLLWLKNYTSTSGFTLDNIKIDPIGNILLAGTRPNFSGRSGAVLITLDNMGNVVNAHTYLDGSYSEIGGIAILPSGLIAGTGSTNGESQYVFNNQYQQQAFAFIADPSGHILHAAMYKQEINSAGKYVNVKNDSTIIITGNYSSIADKDGFFYLKVDTSLWNPQYCGGTLTLTDSLFTVTSANFNTTIAYWQITSASPAVTITTNVLYSTEIGSCPSKTLLRDEANYSISHYVAPVHDGNVVMARTCSDSWASLTKYDPEGTKIWSYKYWYYSDISGSQFPYYVTETSDHSFLLAGGGDYGESGSADLFVYKIDSVGSPLWVRAFYNDSLQIAYIRSIKENRDHSLIAMAGINVTYFSLASRFGLIKYDSLGNIMWSKLYFNGFSLPGDVVEVPGGYILSGTDDSVTRLIKTDSIGNVIWSKKLSLANANSRVQIQALSVAANGQIIAAGYVDYGINNNQPFLPFMMRFDTAGNVIWSKTLNIVTAQAAKALNITNLSNDRYLISASGSDGSIINFRGYVVCMKGNGTRLWSTILNYDSVGGMYLNNTALTRDSSIICAAYIFRGSFNDQARFVKLSKNGDGPCDAGPYNFSVTASGLIVQPQNLTASNLVLHNNTGLIYWDIDSARCRFSCSTPDTTFYHTFNPVGISEYTFVHSETNELILFPNPATDVIHIQSEQKGIVRTIIFNNMGQVIVDEKNNDSSMEQQVNVAELAPGCYFIKVLLEGGEVENLRCIKAR